MKKMFIFLTLILSMSLPAIFSFAQSGDVMISGRVTDQRTGEPLVKAFVMADMLNGRNLVTRTDSSGYYQLDKLSAGMYELSAFAFGYYLKVYPETLAVDMGDIITGIDFELYTMPTGAISGRVIDSLTGEPIVNARIFVHNIDGCEKSLAYSDSSGYYFIDKLQEGFYRASAFAKGYKPLKYSGPVEVIADLIHSGVDFQMKMKGIQREGKIFGQVKDQESGLPVPFAMVIAYSASPYIEYEEITLAGEDGKYVLEDLSILPFKVLATHSDYISEYYREALLAENAAEVTPTSSNIDFTLFDAMEGFLNLGGVVSSEGEPIENASVYAYSISGELMASAISDSEGKYVIENLLPGEYFLLTTSKDGNKQGPNVKLKFKDFCGVDINIGRSGVKDEMRNLPKDISLSQNYPNPFNPSTAIQFSLKVQGSNSMQPLPTSLVIYDILGRKVRTLLNEEMLPGDYQVIWDGKDDRGEVVGSGIYLYQLKSGSYTESREMIRLK